MDERECLDGSTSSCWWIQFFPAEFEATVAYDCLVETLCAFLICRWWTNFFTKVLSSSCVKVEFIPFFHHPPCPWGLTRPRRCSAQQEYVSSEGSRFLGGGGGGGSSVMSLDQLQGRSSPFFPLPGTKGSTREKKWRNGNECMQKGLSGGRERSSANGPRSFLTFFSWMGLCPIGRWKESSLVFPRLSSLQYGPAAAAAHPIGYTLLFYSIRSTFRVPRVVMWRTTGWAGKLTVLLIWRTKG